MGEQSKNCWRSTLTVMWLSLGIVCIVVSSMMIHQGKSDFWIDTYFQNKDLLQLDSIESEWRDTFYADVVTVDSDQDCPTEYSEPLIFDTWHGVPPACDCLDVDFSPERFHYNKGCSRGEYGSQSNSACLDVPGLAPFIQTKIKGYKFCAKKSISYADPNTSPKKDAQPDLKTKTGFQCIQGY